MKLLIIQHQKRERKSSWKNKISNTNLNWILKLNSKKPETYKSEQYDDSTSYARKSLPQNSEILQQKEEFYDLYDHIRKKPETKDQQIELTNNYA